MWRTAAMGRVRPFVTVHEFSSSATCYASQRPGSAKSGLRNVLAMDNFQRTLEVAIMKMLLSVAALALMHCAPVQAQESLFVANVERVTLETKGGQYCSDPCPANGRSNADGSVQICISNDGGCEKTEFVVDRVLFGDIHPGPNTFSTRIGEWGGTHFPITHQPILVHMKQGSVEWASIMVKDGQQLAQVKEFKRGGTVNGVNLRSLAQDDEDSVMLETLVEKLTPHR